MPILQTRKMRHRQEPGPQVTQWISSQVKLCTKVSRCPRLCSSDRLQCPTPPEVQVLVRDPCSQTGFTGNETCMVGK